MILAEGRPVERIDILVDCVLVGIHGKMCRGFPWAGVQVIKVES
jgi:hypothetical protein